MKCNLFFVMLVALVTMLVGGDAGARPGPGVRVVMGPRPIGWVSPGPGWYFVPPRDELLWAPASAREWSTVHDWIGGCVARGRVRRDMVDPLDVLAVLRLEDHLGVPEGASGILAAVWCMEASMLNRGAGGGPIRGDFRGGVARAHGPAQLWPWFRNWCGLGNGGADDLYGALTCYWARVVDRYHYRNASRCGDPWRVAEALTANGPRYLRAGCRAESSHWREMVRWR